MYKNKKKCSKKKRKKSILQNCGHRLGRRTSALPNLSKRGAKDETSDRALTSRAHLRGAYLCFFFWYIASVLF